MFDVDDYQPVACGFYDELGLRMMRGTACRLVFEADDGREAVETTIDDRYTEGDAEHESRGTAAVVERYNADDAGTGRPRKSARRGHRREHARGPRAGSA